MAVKKKKDYSKPKRKCDAVIQVRVTKEQKATIERNAKACKYSNVSEYVRQIAMLHNPKALPPEEFYEVLDYLKACKLNIEANTNWYFGKRELQELNELYRKFDERVTKFYEAA